MEVLSDCEVIMMYLSSFGRNPRMLQTDDRQAGGNTDSLACQPYESAKKQGDDVQAEISIAYLR